MAVTVTLWRGIYTSDEVLEMDTNRLPRHTLLSLLLLVTSAAMLSAQTATSILVRHADRASQERDSPLSARGQERAECLAKTLKDAGITRIYVTEFRRTQQTAQPLSSLIHVEEQKLTAADIAAAAQALRTAPAGSASLYVGHGDTIPKLLDALGARSSPLAEGEFDRMYVLTFRDGKLQTDVELRYCADLGGGTGTMMVPSK